MSLLKTTALAGIGFLGATALGLELEADGVGDFFENTGDMFAHYEEAQEVYEQLEATTQYINNKRGNQSA